MEWEQVVATATASKYMRDIGCEDPVDEVQPVLQAANVDNPQLRAREDGSVFDRSSPEQGLSCVHGQLAQQPQDVPLPVGKRPLGLLHSEREPRDATCTAWCETGPRLICCPVWWWRDCRHQVPQHQGGTPAAISAWPRRGNHWRPWVAWYHQAARSVHAVQQEHGWGS